MPYIVTTLAITALLIFLIMREKDTTDNKKNNRSMINNHIASAPVAIFSKSNCPFCSRAKTLLQKAGANFRVMELNETRNGATIQTELHRMTNQRTVPNIFINGRHFGGNDDLQRSAANGSLRTMLNM